MKTFLTKLLNFFIHFFRRLLFFTTQFIFLIICFIIFVVTYEPNMRKKVTARKIRRIRALTKVKLWLWKHFAWYFKFIHKDKYFENLERRLGNNNSETNK